MHEAFITIGLIRTYSEQISCKLIRLNEICFEYDTEKKVLTNSGVLVCIHTESKGKMGQTIYNNLSVLSQHTWCCMYDALTV